MLTRVSTALLLRQQRLHYAAMLKPTPTTAMGRKIQWALGLPGVTPAKLQALTGVGASGVSEWKRSGRIAKEHLPKLAALTGTIDRWWLEKKAPIPPTGEWLVGAAPASTPPNRGQYGHDLSTLEGQLLSVVDNLSEADLTAVLRHAQSLLFHSHGWRPGKYVPPAPKNATLKPPKSKPR